MRAECRRRIPATGVALAAGLPEIPDRTWASSAGTSSGCTGAREEAAEGGEEAIREEKLVTARNPYVRRLEYCTCATAPSSRRAPQLCAAPLRRWRRSPMGAIRADSRRRRRGDARRGAPASSSSARRPSARRRSRRRETGEIGPPRWPPLRTTCVVYGSPSLRRCAVATFTDGRCAGGFTPEAAR